MSIFHRLMNKLGRYRLILDRRTGEEYMDRYYIFLKDRKWFPFNITINRIKKSDDPILYDQPWFSLTIVLSGGYYDHAPLYNNTGNKICELSTWRGLGSVKFRRARDFHYIELESERPVTTLTIMGPRYRDWGFLVETKRDKHRWIHHDYYLTTWKEYHEKYIVTKASSMARKRKI